MFITDIFPCKLVGVKKVRRVCEQGKDWFMIYTRYANASGYYKIAQTHTEHPHVS